MAPARKIAENFIKDQLGIMREFGNEPKLSAKRYEAVVTKAQKSFESLRPQSNSRAKAKAARKK